MYVSLSMSNFVKTSQTTVDISISVFAKTNGRHIENLLSLSTVTTLTTVSSPASPFESAHQISLESAIHRVVMT